MSILSVCRLIYSLQNRGIVNDCITPYCTELKLPKYELLSLVQWQESSAQVNSGEAPHPNASLSRVELFEWLIINFSIWIDASIYYKATRFLELASIIAGIELSFDGELGRRTRFQQRSLPQLCAKVWLFVLLRFWFYKCLFLCLDEHSAY